MPAPALYGPDLTLSTMPNVRIGTVDLPERVDRARYFQELTYLELSALFNGPLSAGALSKWKPAPAHALGFVAPWVLTQRKPPKAARLWPHDASVGDFRDSAPGRAALSAVQAAVTEVTAGSVVFHSPPLFAPSTANRDRLKQFFAEVATESAIGARRVWIPDGLWEPRTAVAFAAEINVTCALDPLVHDPNTPQEVYEDLAAPALYFRISGLGRSGPIRQEKLEDLLGLVEHYSDSGIDLTIAFASAARWQDARNLKKLLGGVLDDALLAGAAGSPDLVADSELDDDELDESDEDSDDDDDGDAERDD